MLLSLMRRHAKSWLIKFLIAIIAVVFIFYFGYSFSSREGTKMAYVNGELISGLEYQKTYRQLLEALQREYKSVWSDNLIKAFDIKNRAMDQLINQMLVSQEAKRIGLDVTEKEIQTAILSYPSFQFQGRFDENRYRNLLDNNHMKPEDFESEVAMNLLQKKVGQFLMTFLPVTDQEVKDQYVYMNGKVKVGFVEFPPEKYKDSVKGDEAGLEQYFKEHQEEYRIPEKIKISYLLIDPKTFEGEVKVTDQDVKDYYMDHQENFKLKKEVKARHILFKLAKDAPEENVKEVRARVTKVLEKARKGEDFAALAKEYSEGPTAEKGGDLGYFSKGQMVKPFEDAVFKMKQGEISDLVRTDFGFHIIFLEDVKEARTKTLAEVREEITKKLKEIASTDLAHEKALTMIDQMPYDVDLAKYASEQGLTAKPVGYFSQDEPIPDIKGDSKLRKSLFSLQKGDVSELIEFEGKFYIIQVLDKKPSVLPELAEVKEKVNEDYLGHLASEKAKSSAEAYLESLKGGESWDALAEKRGLSAETTDFFSRNDFIQQIGNSPDLQEAAFHLSEGHRVPDKVFETDKGVFVIRWEGKEDIDEKKYQEDKEQYRQSIMTTRYQQVYQGWIDHLKKQADIEILQPLDSEV